MREKLWKEKGGPWMRGVNGNLGTGVGGGTQLRDKFSAKRKLYNP